MNVDAVSFFWIVCLPMLPNAVEIVVVDNSCTGVVSRFVKAIENDADEKVEEDESDDESKKLEEGKDNPR